MNHTGTRAGAIPYALAETDTMNSPREIRLSAVSAQKCIAPATISLKNSLMRTLVELTALGALRALDDETLHGRRM